MKSTAQNYESELNDTDKQLTQLSYDHYKNPRQQLKERYQITFLVNSILLSTAYALLSSTTKNLVRVGQSTSERGIRNSIRNGSISRDITIGGFLFLLPRTRWPATCKTPIWLTIRRLIQSLVGTMLTNSVGQRTRLFLVRYAQRNSRRNREDMKTILFVTALYRCINMETYWFTINWWTVIM